MRSIFPFISTSTNMFYYSKHEMVSQDKYFMCLSKAIIYRAYCTPSNLLFVTGLPTLFQAHQCFKHVRQAQQAPVGAPGRAQCLQVTKRTDHHVNMSWITSWWNFQNLFDSSKNMCAMHSVTYNKHY